MLLYKFGATEPGVIQKIHEPKRERSFIMSMLLIRLIKYMPFFMFGMKIFFFSHDVSKNTMIQNSFKSL